MSSLTRGTIKGPFYRHFYSTVVDPEHGSSRSRDRLCRRFRRGEVRRNGPGGDVGDGRWRGLCVYVSARVYVLCV